MDTGSVDTPDTHAITTKRAIMLLWSGFAILIGLGLFLLLVSAVRSGLLHFGSTPITDTQVKIVSVLPASLVAGAITLAGILLTDAHNRRTSQLASEAEQNRERLAKEEDRRIRLEFVTKSIDLLTEGQNYAKAAQVAGALATIVNLGYTSVALKTLESSWADGAVDANVATWLIDQAIVAGDHDQITDASTILLAHAPELARKMEVGVISTPSRPSPGEVGSRVATAGEICIHRHPDAGNYFACTVRLELRRSRILDAMDSLQRPG